MDTKVLAILAVMIVVGGSAGYYVFDHQIDSDESDSTKTANIASYSGAILTNYNSSATSSPATYSNIDAIWKGTSGNTMVFQIAEIKNCVYAVIGYTGGDGYEKTLTASDSKTIGSSFETSTSKSIQHTKGSETEHMDGYSNSLGGEIGTGAPCKIFVDISVQYSHEWSHSDTTKAIESITDSTTYQESITENLSKTSGYSQSVKIPTERGKDYAWAYTTTAYVFELVNFKYDESTQKYVLDLPVQYAISYDINNLRDYVFETDYGSSFDFKYATESQYCILTDQQINAALNKFNGETTVNTHTIKFYKDSSGTQIYSTSNLAEGGAVVFPTSIYNPTYKLKGWTSSKNSNEILTETVLVSGDAEYYPVFEDLYPGYTRIYTASDFTKINNNLSGKYVLANTEIISLSYNYVPIGNSNSPFIGTLVGEGNQITFTYTDTPSVINKESAVGLFGVIGNGAVIDNIRVSGNINISANTSTNDYWLGLGGVAGISHGGTIQNCISSITIKTTDERGHSIRTCAGSIVGVVSQNTVNIIDCKGNNTIDAVYGEWTFVGGIIGCSKTTAVVTHCNASGTINGHGNEGWFDFVNHRAVAGGILGWTEGGNGTFVVQYCCSECYVKCNGRYSDSGGIIGNDSVGKGSVSYCCFVKDRLFEEDSSNPAPNDAVAYGGTTVSNVIQTSSENTALNYHYDTYSHMHGCWPY